jgi:LacI family transcriptional regulator
LTNLESAIYTEIRVKVYPSFGGNVSKVGERLISMKRISELTGVSIATVSRVINNNGRFSRDTRENVLKVIHKYGYTPNALAQGLRKNKTKNIGVIVPDITNEFFAKLTHYIQQALFDAEYSTLIYNTNENVELEERHIQALTAQIVSGIIFIAGGRDNTFLQVPLVPTIFLDRKPHLKNQYGDYIQIHTDHLRGGYLAGKCLLEGGCRKPGIVMDKRKLFSQTDRLKGFKKALDEKNIALDKNSIVCVEKIDYETAYKVFTNYLVGHPVNDGYFCTTDWLAIGVMAALLDKNIKIPEDVKLAGFDNISIAEHARIPLTTIHQDVKGLAELAVGLMIKMLNKEPVEKYEYILDPVLVRRKSSG